MSAYEPRAVYRDGVVRYPDAAAIKADLEPFLGQRIICASGERFPPLLEDFDFRLALPDGATFPLRGQIISLRGGSVLIQVASFTDSAWAAIKAAAGPVTSSSAPPRSVRDPGPPRSVREPPASRRGEARVERPPAGKRAPPRSEVSPATARPRPASAPVDRVKQTHDRKAAGSHFDVLGLHFSAGPSQLRKAHLAMMSEYSPGSPAHAESPVYAEKLIALANRAWLALETRPQRDKYRREVMKVDVEAAAALAAEQGKLARVRQETERARELLEAAVDLNPLKEYLAALQGL